MALHASQVKKTESISAFRITALSTIMAALIYSTSAGAQEVELNLPAQSLQQSIQQLAHQSHVDIIYVGDILNNKNAQALKGKLPVEQALKQLLTGTDLTIRKEGEVYVIVAQSSAQTQSVNRGASAVRTSSGQVQLPTITVTSPQDNIYDQPRSISEITRKQLDDRPAKHAADMLEQTAGVYTSVSQQDPALSVNIRGIQDYGRVNMNIDGMRQNFQKSGHGERNGQMYIDAELLSGVKIEKGATSGMGGAGAFGGIATFNTVSASDFLDEEGKNIGGQVRTATGSNGTNFIGSAVVAAKYDDIDFLVGISNRNLNDYNAGNKGNISGIRTHSVALNASTGYVNSLRGGTVTNSNYEMTSYLAKLGWNMHEGERLQVTYLETKTATPNAGMIGEISTNPYALGWKSVGFSDVTAQNYSVDYSLKPSGQNWLDLKTKFYYVNTKDDTDTYATNTAGTDGYLTHTQLKTYGFQLQNTSTLLLAPKQSLAVNYGTDIFYDEASSNSTLRTMNGVTPTGNRLMSSIFGNLTYHYDDWLRVDGGLRYDYYRLRGQTAMNIFDFPYTVDNPCTERSAARCSVSYTKTWDVNNQQGKVSPTAAIAIKPGVSWMEVFANYGKGYRPPAITETLTTGSAHSSSVQYPNPFLQSEESKSWETGVNVQFDGLLTERDRLQSKISYFDTSIDNYINFETYRTVPGLFAPSSGNAAYVNNLVKTHFRGLEYQVNYDAGVFYADLSYTRMIGQNNSCTKPAWLGGVITYGGSSRNYYAVPITSWDTFVRCNYGTLFGSAAYAPTDRGSLTLGGRAFDRKLDFGTVIRYNKGYQDPSVINSLGSVGAYYIADWPTYTLFDIYAHYQINKNLKVSASVENVTNRAYIVSYGDTLSYTLGRGRTVQIGMEYRF